MTTQIIALDNIKVTTDLEVSNDVVLTCAEYLNAMMERRKPEFAKAYTDLLLYGHCEMDL